MPTSGSSSAMSASNPPFSQSLSMGDLNRPPLGAPMPPIPSSSAMSMSALPAVTAPPVVSQQQQRVQAIASADSIVEEYLVYRGFTQSFRALQSEKASDKLKSLDVTKIVEQTFQYIHAFEMDHFIALWDFLTQRFFQHLDQEYVHLAEHMRADLLRYYLVNAKRKKPARLLEFFSIYSHEILSETDGGLPFRRWYVLPYISEPEKDPEFAVYFTVRWADMLRMSLFNLLSVVIKTAPTPKLLLIDRWVQSESQESLRNEVRNSLENILRLESEVKSSERRIRKLHAVIRDLTLFIHKRVGAQGSAPPPMRRSSETAVDSIISVGGSDTPTFEEKANDMKERRRVRVQKAGEIACLMTQACYDRNSGEIMDEEVSTAAYSNIVDVVDIETEEFDDTIRNLSLMSPEELESNLVMHVADWLQCITK